MNKILLAFKEIGNSLPWPDIFAALLLIVASQIFLKIFNKVFDVMVENKKEKGRLLSGRKAFVYFFNFMILALSLKVLKIEMKVILGAAGFLTLAIGFAARTPISNLISGVFLLFERPFVVGNIIEVGEHKGEVVSRNLLSLTMRTLDNLMVRIPNEVVIGNSVSNMSHFPIRRLEVKYLLSSKDSLTRLEEIFHQVAGRNGLALNEPEPYFKVEEFRENCTVVVFLVWCTSDDFMEFQSEFPKELHRAVKAAGMESIRHRVELAQPIVIKSDELKS